MLHNKTPIKLLQYTFSTSSIPGNP
jgi:hypothetical protein